MRRPADRFHAVGIMGAQTRNTSTEGQAAGLTGGCMARSIIMARAGEAPILRAGI